MVAAGEGQGLRLGGFVLHNVRNLKFGVLWDIQDGCQHVRTNLCFSSESIAGGTPEGIWSNSAVFVQDRKTCKDRLGPTFQGPDSQYFSGGKKP